MKAIVGQSEGYRYVNEVTDVDFHGYLTYVTCNFGVQCGQVSYLPFI